MKAPTLDELVLLPEPLALHRQLDARNYRTFRWLLVLVALCALAGIAASADLHDRWGLVLYPLDLPIKQKIEAIARTMYGADGVDYSAAAETQIARYTELGYGNLAVCVAKTHLSLSHDPTLLGRPRGFRVPVREVRASVGAGFLYPLLGEMRTMPGLPSEPNAWKVDLDADGNVVGLF